MAYASWSVVFGEQPSAAKWNILGTNDASFNDGTGIAASAITPEKLFTGTGTTWPWQSWTPTLTGSLAVGNGTAIAKYRQIGKTVHFNYNITFGSTTVIGTNGTFSLPVSASTNHIVNGCIDGAFMAYDTSATTYYPGLLIYQSTDKIIPVTLNAAAAGSATATGNSSTTPMTWATGDLFVCCGSYEAT